MPASRDPIFRNMDQAALDAAYNNLAAIADPAARLRDLLARSAATYRRGDVRRDLAYGPGPAHRLDWLDGGEGPTLVFLHGGYWQSRAKQEFAFVADGAREAGMDVVLGEYPLGPAARMADMVQAVARLIDFVAARARGPLWLAGHSAGAQLAALHHAHPAVAAVIGISGIYDLTPIRLSYLNAGIRLTEADVAAFSPLTRIGPGAPVLLCVGGAELPELQRQTRDYADALGPAASTIAAPGHDHLSVLDELAAGAILAGVRAFRPPSTGS